MITGNETVHPTSVQHEPVNIQGGITLRQYYAGLAMQGILSAALTSKDAIKVIMGISKATSDELRNGETVIAKLALKNADALIEALNK